MRQIGMIYLSCVCKQEIASERFIRLLSLLTNYGLTVNFHYTVLEHDQQTHNLMSRLYERSG